MSRTVIVQRWCDGEHDEPAEATTERIIKVDDSRPMLLDLCDEHDQFVRVLEVLASHGVDASSTVPKNASAVERGRRGGRPPKEGPDVNRTCPICQFTSSTRGALGQHLKTRHGTNLRSANA